MHIGFRYHVATLVAVFFSLFLGILVGSILFQDDLLVQEQNSIINELEDRFNQLQARTKDFQANLKQAELREALILEGWDLIRHALIADRLSGHQVVLFADGKEAWPAARLTAALEAAGARVAGTIMLPSTVGGLEPLYAELGALDLHQPIAVIWIGDQCSDAAKQGVDYLRRMDWQICILHPYGSNPGLAAWAQDALIINIGDLFLGELAMVWGLGAGSTGTYGYGDAAVALVPGLESE